MSLRKQATTGVVWTFAQQFGNQLVGFFVSLVLARLLLPAEFGLIGMIAVFVSIGNTLLNGGLTNSLIRSKELEEDDFSTVFFFNLGASVIIYGIIFFLAPLIADFYNQEILTNLLRVYSITFVIQALSAVQLARLTKKMDFKTQTIISIPATLLGGGIGIWMAYAGFGVWSLVASYVITSLFSTIQLWFYSKWSPIFVFNKEKFIEHLNFGYKLTISELLETVFRNVYIIIIGRYFSAAQVGFYTRAETLKQLPVINISSALNKVTYPLFANIQDDNERLKRVYKQIMQMVIFIIAPILVFMAVLAEPIFRLLFTEKWLPAVPYFQILCANGILYPIHAYNLNVLKVKGRSDLFLRLEIFKKILVIIAVFIALQFGIMALLYSQVITSVLAFFINTHYTGKFINYNSWSQFRDIFPTIFLASLCAVVVYLFDYFYLNTYIDIFRISIGGFLGVLIYLIIAYFLKFNSLNNIQKLILKK